MKTKYKLSEYQENILNYVQNSNGNLLVDAKAGSGKTFTLQLLADKFNEMNKKCLLLAFNKAIQEELSQKISSPNCVVKTVHSLGLSFIRSYLYKKHNTNYNLEIDTKKDRLKETIKKYFAQTCYDDFYLIMKETMSGDELKQYTNDIISELCHLYDFCRFYYIDFNNVSSITSIMEICCDELRQYNFIGMKDFYKIIQFTYSELMNSFLNPESIDGKPTYYIDYVDMTYLPLFLNMYPPYQIREFLDYVMIDESQDLSILQQLFIKQLDNGKTRFVFVGDRNQAIYGFAGADVDSIDNIKNNFTLAELPLNICYRCPENIIKVSQTIVPEILWNKDREDKGNIKFINTKELIKLTKPNDIILSRKNSDLLAIYRQFVITNKKRVKFRNKAIIDGILRELKKAIKAYITSYNSYENIDVKLYDYLDKNDIKRNRKLRTKEQQVIVEEKVRQLVEENEAGKPVINKSNWTVDYLKKAMKEFKEEGPYNFLDQDDIRILNYSLIEDLIEQFEENSSSITVKAFEEYIYNFLVCNDLEDAPVLSTIHGMKGGEGDNVFILNYPRFPYKFKNQSESDVQQETNLQYVALTRAKQKLYLVLCDNPNNDDNIKEMNNKCIHHINNILSD